ncbi:hypothetical protein BDW66DRAFT_61976 [Aspergillus desertorum]
MASQEKSPNIPSNPSQRNLGQFHLARERHQTSSFHSQRRNPRTQWPLNNLVEPVGLNRTGSICPRCRPPSGHCPDCANFNIIHESKSRKEHERGKAIQQAPYKASLVLNKPVAAAAAAAPHGLANYPTGSAPPPPSAWPTATINLTDDAFALLPLPSTTAPHTVSSSYQYAPSTCGGLGGEEAPMFGTPPLQDKDRFTALLCSVAERSPTPFAPPDGPPSSPSKFTSCQPKSAISADTPFPTVSHRDQLSGDPACRRSNCAPFELSPGLPSSNYRFIASARPTHIPNADASLDARHCPLLETPRPLRIDRPSAPASHGGGYGPGNLTPHEVGLGFRAATTRPLHMSTSQLFSETGKRTYSAFTADDTLFASPSPSNTSSGSGSSLGSRRTAPLAAPLNGFTARAALRAHSCLTEFSHSQHSCLAGDPRMSSTVDSVRILAPSPQPPTWPRPPSTSSPAPSSATASIWPLPSPALPPPLPRPVPGYVWAGNDWHGPVWTWSAFLLFRWRRVMRMVLFARVGLRLRLRQ